MLKKHLPNKWINVGKVNCWGKNLIPTRARRGLNVKEFSLVINNIGDTNLEGMDIVKDRLY